MDATTVKEIADLGRKSVPGTLLDLDRRRKILTLNGESQIIDIPEQEVKNGYVVATIADFAEIIDNNAYDGSPVLFDEYGAVCVLDVEAHAQCKIEFARTEGFDRVKTLYDDASKFQHVQLLRFLRVLPIDPGVLAAFRTLDFRVMQQAVSNRSMGQESLDKSVKAEMGEASGKPTHFFITLTPFKTAELASFQITARIEVEYHIAEGAVELWWNDADYEQAQRAWIDLIRDKLQQKCAGRSIIQGAVTIKRV